MQSEAHYDVVIIGGGASGMMAAIAAAEHGASVLLLEKNKQLGEKLRITGGGRCNITNAEDNPRELLKHYGKAEQFLYSAFSQFGVQDTLTFFDDLLLPIKIEARKRAFPESEKASDVVEVLQERMKYLKVTVKVAAHVTKVLAHNGHVESIKVNGNSITGKNFILATGGTSHPETGSTGDGFGWLRTLGHKIKDPTPSITPLAIKEQWVKNNSGVKLENIALHFYQNNVKCFSIAGAVLFTHFGISGPTILNNAYRVSELLENGEVTATIDCYPKKDEKSLDKEIVEMLNANGNKLLKNTLALFCPPGIAAAIKDMLNDIQFLETKNSEVTKEMRKKIVTSLKHMPMTIEKLMGLDRAVVADGGISLTEIDTRTMLSKKLDNLYIIGDLLDINRPSGGYSLQLCWTSGFVAGTHAAKLL